eukprot:scaffold13378_cov24-Tisochrysis_lutea.AAC.1
MSFLAWDTRTGCTQVVTLLKSRINAYHPARIMFLRGVGLLRPAVQAPEKIYVFEHAGVCVIDDLLFGYEWKQRPVSVRGALTAGNGASSNPLPQGAIQHIEQVSSVVAECAVGLPWLLNTRPQKQAGVDCPLGNMLYNPKKSKGELAHVLSMLSGGLYILSMLAGT